MKRKFLIVLSLLVICAGAASIWYVRAHAAVSEFPSDALALLPSDSSVIVYADMASLRDEPLVQRLVTMAPAVTPGTEYADFIAATGFEYQRDLDRVVMASSTAATPQTPQAPPSHVVVIADGRFDQKKIEAYALRTGKMQQINGHAVYTTTSATPGKITAFTFLNAGRVAIADNSDIAAVLADHPAAPPDAPLREQISRVAGAPIFMIAKAQAIMPAAGRAAGMSASMLSGLRWLNLAARPQAEHVILSAEGACDTDEQAKQIASTLELLRGFSRGMLSDPKARGNMPAEMAVALSQMLQTAQITTDTSRVRLLLNVDPAMFAAMPAPVPPPASR